MTAVTGHGDGPAVRWGRLPGPLRAALVALQALTADRRDALLYGASAVFAGATALLSGIPLYREWGAMAAGPYAAAALLMAVAARDRKSVV